MDNKKNKNKSYKNLPHEIEENMDPLTKEIYNNLNECYIEELKRIADKYLDKMFGKNKK